MRRKTKRIIIIAIVSILTCIVLSVCFYFYSLGAVANSSDKVKFTITSGTSSKEIIDDLYDSNIIKSKVMTYLYVKLHNSILQAGTYELDRASSTKEIINTLSSGDVIDNTYTITFVEGKRLKDYVKIISETFSYDEEEILQTISDTDYLKELIAKYDFLTEEILDSDIYYPLEGYLFPSTYEFYQDASIEDIIEKMLDKTSSVLSEYQEAIASSGYTTHEILTMASIIENETMYEEDKVIVSQVIYKRLALNMSLGMDVTTYYGAQKDLTETLNTVDLNAENAYNTRNTSFIGLPVGPISNPSETSILAALNPSDTNYLYFYADITTGKLYFAENYQDFQNLIELYG